MLNPPIKTCKTCDKTPMKGRRFCLSCIREQEKEKAKEKLAKDRAKERINIRLSGVDDTDREELRKAVKEAVWPFLQNKQIQIKVSRGKHNSEKLRNKKKADDLWSEAVKVNYGYKCAYCGTSDNLNSHHIYTRSRMATRWDMDNGICLCADHHTFSQEFSAHKTPAKFYAWLCDLKWEDYVMDIEKKSQSICKVTSDILEWYIKEFKEFI